MDLDAFKEQIEPYFLELVKQGYEFVVVYRHRKDDDLVFYDAYKSFYERQQAPKHWLNEGYVVNRVYDLDYLDTRSEREKRRSRPDKGRAVLGD